jgi:hypothetical protein
MRQVIRNGLSLSFCLQMFKKQKSVLAPVMLMDAADRKVKA